MKPKKKATAAKRTRLLSRIAKLTPTQFENLVFDLMVARGMVNVAWRTPGADGGRDIEGSVAIADFTGYQSTQRWFVECKRYKGSVNWPTIYEKTSYAHLKADVLLMCTTSSFTPAAITEVDRWNESRQPVMIRLWPGHELELQLSQHPDLLIKYGLSDAVTTPGRSIVTLALALSKSVSSHYSATVFKDAEVDLMLQAAQGFSNLLLKRMEDIEREGEIRIAYPLSRPTLIKCAFPSDGIGMDEYGLVAFAAYLVALSKCEIKIECPREGICILKAATDLQPYVARYGAVFSSIAMWSDIEFQSNNKEIRLIQRKGE